MGKDDREGGRANGYGWQRVRGHRAYFLPRGHSQRYYSLLLFNGTMKRRTNKYRETTKQRNNPADSFIFIHLFIRSIQHIQTGAHSAAKRAFAYERRKREPVRKLQT